MYNTRFQIPKWNANFTMVVITENEHNLIEVFLQSEMLHKSLHHICKVEIYLNQIGCERKAKLQPRPGVTHTQQISHGLTDWDAKFHLLCFTLQLPQAS